jgi:hypothetical protein
MARAIPETYVSCRYQCRDDRVVPDFSNPARLPVRSPMKFLYIPPIAPAQIPLLILLTIAGAACLLLIGELRGRLAQMSGKLRKQSTARERAKASLASFVAIALASAALFLIGGLIGLGFGPFYFIICTASALLTIYLGLGHPSMARRVESMSTAQLTWRVTALVAACLALALFLKMLLGRSGLPF